MSRSSKEHRALLTIVVLLAVGVGMPAHALTKLYQFPARAGETSLRVITHGMEYFSTTYATPSASALPGYAVFGGLFSSTLTYYGSNLTSIGFSTYDYGCYVKDLRYGSGVGVVPNYASGYPGSGQVIDYDPGTQTLTIALVNATGKPMPLGQTDFRVFGSAPGLAELQGIAQAGFHSVAEWVSFLVAAIDALSNAVGEAQGDGLPPPSARSLQRKLEKARDRALAGLAKWEAGDQTKALFLWEKAAHHMDTFVSELTNKGRSRRARIPAYRRLWIAAAKRIAAGLRALPDGPSLQTELSAPAVAPPAPPGLTAWTYVEWPVSVLPAGGYTAFVVPNVPPPPEGVRSAAVAEGAPAGFVWRGRLRDARGRLILTYVELAPAEDPLADTTPPVIVSASADPPNLPLSENHEMQEIALDVTVTDNSGHAAWYIEDVRSNEPEGGTSEDDLYPDILPRMDGDRENLRELWLRRERSPGDNTDSREYSIWLNAFDMAGNQAHEPLTWEVGKGGATPSREPDVVVPVTRGGLSDDVITVGLSSVAAVQTKSGGVQVVFTLASDSRVEAEVINIAGRRIKQIVGDKELASGVNSLVWNASSDRGLRVPSGTYLIRVTARTEDGGEATRICPVTIRR